MKKMTRPSMNACCTRPDQLQHRGPDPLGEARTPQPDVFQYNPTMVQTRHGSTGCRNDEPSFAGLKEGGGQRGDDPFPRTDSVV